MSTREIEVQPDWMMALRFWWAFMWRLFLYNAVIGSLCTLAYRQFGGKNDLTDVLMTAISAVIFFSLEIWLMRGLLSRRFGNFRIAVFRQEA